MRRIPTRPWAALALALALAGCSGGGGSTDTGGDTNDHADEVYNLDAAVTAVYQSGFQVNNLRATDTVTAKQYVMAFAIAPQADEVFEGTSRRRVLRTTAAAEAGTSNQVIDQGLQYYATDPFRPVGSRSTRGLYQVTVPAGVLPSSATPGRSGSLGVAVIFADSTKVSQLATSITGWSLERDTATTAYMCFNTVITPADGSADLRNSECLLLDRSRNGAAVGARITASIPTATGDVNLEFR